MLSAPGCLHCRNQVGCNTWPTNAHTVWVVPASVHVASLDRRPGQVPQLRRMEVQAGVALSLRSMVAYGVVLVSTARVGSYGTVALATNEIMRQTWMLVMQCFGALDVSAQALVAAHLGRVRLLDTSFLPAWFKCPRSCPFGSLICMLMQVQYTAIIRDTALAQLDAAF